MKSYTHLTRDERVKIETLLNENKTHAYIAQRLNRSRSTISREIKKRTNRQWVYTADKADHHAYIKRLNKQKQMKKIRAHPFIEHLVRDLLLKWRSPEKISMRIALEYHVQLSGIAIRRYLDSSYWCALKQELKCKKLIVQYRAINKEKTQGRVPNRISISLRPFFVSSPLTVWHYECDFIVSTKDDKTVILTLVDKYSRFKIAQHLPDKQAWRVRDALLVLIKQHGIKTITFDNDLSFAYHGQLGIKTYFSDPYCSRQKWQIERANRERRRFFPKKTILKNISQEMLDRATFYLNHNPMKCFAGRTPREVQFNTSINYLTRTL